MWLNNKLCNIVVTDGTNQSHNINGIYDVHLHCVSKKFPPFYCL